MKVLLFTRRGWVWAVAIGLTGLGFITAWHFRTPQTASPKSSEWLISSEPTLVIGGTDEAPLYYVGAVIQLSDGRIIVGDGLFLSPRLRSFSSEGQYLGVIGRAGDGPGEYRWAGSLQRGANDSIFVYDPSLQRLTVFSGSGQVGRTGAYRVQGGVTGSDGLASVRRLTEGVWVGRGLESTLPAPPYEIVRDTIVIGLMDGALSDLRPLAYLPGAMTTTILIAGRRGFRYPAFSAKVIDATWGRCVFMASTDSRSVSVYASDGSLVSRFEGPGSRRLATDQHLQASIAADVVLFPEDERQIFRRSAEDAARPEELPFYNQMVVDQWGHIWLQRYAPEFALGKGPDWFVLSQDGRHLSNEVLPTGMDIYSITEDGLLGMRRGDLDEEMVELLPWLGRPPEEVSLPQCIGN